MSFSELLATLLMVLILVNGCVVCKLASEKIVNLIKQDKVPIRRKLDNESKLNLAIAKLSNRMHSNHQSLKCEIERKLIQMHKMLADTIDNQEESKWDANAIDLEIKALENAFHNMEEKIEKYMKGDSGMLKMKYKENNKEIVLKKKIKNGPEETFKVSRKECCKGKKQVMEPKKKRKSEATISSKKNMKNGKVKAAWTQKEMSLMKHKRREESNKTRSHLEMRKKMKMKLLLNAKKYVAKRKSKRVNKLYKASAEQIW